MPDPAIEAIKAGLPYTEPTSRGLFSRNKKPAKAQVTWEVNPHDPTAPPRRVINVDGNTGGGWFASKKLGSNVLWGQKTSAYPGSRPMPVPGQSAHSAAQGLMTTPTSATLPPDPPFPAWTTLPATSSTIDPYAAHPHAPLDLSTAGSHSLSRGQRRHLEKMRAEQEKALREWDKAQREWEKALGRETKRRVKEELKKKKDELKAQEKALRKQRKHPDRAMPTPTPASDVPTPGPASATHSDTGNVKWMMTPTYEEFGVRRPLDASGTWPQVGGASEWPMMSRTMTHALVDMAREERVHAVSAGTVWGGGWGGQW